MLLNIYWMFLLPSSITAQLSSATPEDSWMPLQAHGSWSLGNFDFNIPSTFFFFLFQKLHFSKTLLACDILEQPLCPISKTEHLSPLKKQPVTFPAGKASQKMMIMLIKWVSASPVAVLEAFSTLITMLYF